MVHVKIPYMQFRNIPVFNLSLRQVNIMNVVTGVKRLFLAQSSKKHRGSYVRIYRGRPFITLMISQETFFLDNRIRLLLSETLSGAFPDY